MVVHCIEHENRYFIVPRVSRARNASRNTLSEKYFHYTTTKESQCNLPRVLGKRMFFLFFFIIIPYFALRGTYRASLPDNFPAFYFVYLGLFARARTHAFRRDLNAGILLSSGDDTISYRGRKKRIARRALAVENDERITRRGNR